MATSTALAPLATATTLCPRAATSASIMRRMASWSSTTRMCILHAITGGLLEPAVFFGFSPAPPSGGQFHLQPRSAGRLIRRADEFDLGPEMLRQQVRTKESHRARTSDRRWIEPRGNQRAVSLVRDARTAVLHQDPGPLGQ